MINKLLNDKMKRTDPFTDHGQSRDQNDESYLSAASNKGKGLPPMPMSGQSGYRSSSKQVPKGLHANATTTSKSQEPKGPTKSRQFRQKEQIVIN